MKKLLTALALSPIYCLAQYSIHTLDSLIHHAVDTHLSTLVIPKGTYRGTTPGNSFIWIQNASNLHIVADSVTMICEKRVRALEFTHCSGITLEGLTIDYDPLTYTQGDIVSVGSNYVDVKIHQGYPVEAWSRIDIVDPLTRYRKRGSVFLWNSTAQLLGGDTIRVTNTDQPNISAIAAVGDMATMSYGPESGGAPHAFVISDCDGGMVFKNVTVCAAPGFGIFEAGGAGGTTLENCSVKPGAKPAGAVQERLLSSSWDAIQHKLTRNGPTVEHCVVESAGDDTWSVTWDGDYIIGSASGNSITVDKDNLQVGDSLRASLSSDVVYVTSKSGTTLVLNKACPWTAGTHLYSPSRRCENFTLRNNYFHSTGRVLIKAGHGVIEGNVFDNMHNGVTLDTELGVSGATGISHVAIRNNQIIGSGYFMPGYWKPDAGAISVVNGGGDSIAPVGSFDSITIANNRFTGVNGVNIVVTAASRVKIAENNFYDTGLPTPNATGGQVGISQQTVVFLKNNDQVTLDSNVVHHSGLDSLLVVKSVVNLQKLRKGIFDTDGQVYSNVTPYCCGNGGGNAFDGNVNSFVDASAANGAYTGRDFNRVVILDSIYFYPRSSFAYRMTGGRFQGSVDGISYTDLYTIPAEPTSGWTRIAAGGNYQYFRYSSPDGGFCNVAEIVFLVHDDTTGVNEPSPKKNNKRLLKKLLTAIKGYPNPLKDILHITGLNQADQRCDLELYRISGQLVCSMQKLRIAPPGMVSVKLPSLPPGAYLLKLSTPSGWASIPLIK